MDKYDPEKRVGLIVDEWGTWYNVEPGTNPGFLYQQNSIRDAMVAAVTLNIFHKHADRVHMANIAQMINVLQSMLLTEGDKIVKTPTYHVFDLYQDHMEAQLVDSYGDVEEHVSYTASKKDGKVTISICNYDLEATRDLTFTGPSSVVKAEFITADTMDAHNTFENPSVVEKREFAGYEATENGLKVSLPPMSVATIVLE